MPFNLVGHARAVANMSIGQITLDPINFDVPSSLNGLRGLDGLVRIESVDVLGGSEGAISLGIDGAWSRFAVCLSSGTGRIAYLVPGFTFAFGISCVGSRTLMLTLAVMRCSEHIQSVELEAVHGRHV